MTEDRPPARTVEAEGQAVRIAHVRAHLAQIESALRACDVRLRQSADPLARYELSREMESLIDRLGKLRANLDDLTD